jgi:hypothetical protein
MRMSCSITPRRVAAGGPVFPLVIETTATASTVIAIATPSSKTVAYRLDTRHFGFTGGADIGRHGAKEFLIDFTLRDTAGTGCLANKASAPESECTALQGFRIFAGGALAYYEITGIAGIEGPRRAAVQSLFFHPRYRLVDRDHAPLGLTVSTAQLRGFVDETSGLRAARSDTKVQLLAARELSRELGACGRWGRAYKADHARRVAGSETRPAGSHRTRSQRLFGSGTLRRPHVVRESARSGFAFGQQDYRISGEATARAETLALTNSERHQAKLQSSFEFGARIWGRGF